MLYLISETNQRIIKIGYTDDLTERINTYYTYNPNAYLIGAIEGNKRDEMNWHLVLKALGFKEIIKNERPLEWFEIPTEINKKDINKDGFKFLMELCYNYYEK